MEFKGTKGKWEVVKDVFYGSALVKHNAFTICKLNVAHDDSITEANALLISKAPEMLDMLKECKLQLEYLNEKFIETGTTNSLLSKIELLIKQATEL